ncbi:hypothetical protein ACP70R_045155 [Stipagrostis hirtigluma subsp. patula]
MAPEGNRKARRPQFLKVLFAEFMEKMPIPAKFMRRHLAHEHGRRRATLMGRPGKFWHVDVEPGDGDGGDGDGDGACFTAGGWAEFVGANAVAPGSFLVFRYEGNMVFTVKVFDASGCIKEYGDGGAATSVEPTAPGHQSNRGAGWKSQPTSKIQDTSPLPQKTRKCNKRKFAYDDDIVPEKQSRCPQIPIVENEFAQEQYTQTETHSDIASEAKRSGYEDTLPNIGKKFCTRNGLVTNRLMTLKDQEGRSWPVNLTLTSDQVRMKGGWGHFSGHHGIKVGDQCVFRLTDPNTFTVSINRAP